MGHASATNEIKKEIFWNEITPSREWNEIKKEIFLNGIATPKGVERKATLFKSVVLCIIRPNTLML